MEIRKGKQLNPHRLRSLPRKPKAAAHDVFVDEEKDIVCHYGVAVHRTVVAGLELVEYEFLPDAA